MSGYALREGPAVGIHDNLYARALYLRGFEEEFAIVVADILGVDSDLYYEIANRVEQELGISPGKLVVLGTHTHSGPALQSYWTDVEVSTLREVFVMKIVEALKAATRKLTEVKVADGIGELRDIVVNRRSPKRGPIDPRVHVIAFYRDSSLEAILSNYTCHAVVLGANNRLISADYPGALNRTVETLTGAFSIFLNGTCGDINPLTPRTVLDRIYDRSVGTFDDVEWMGKILACEVVKIALSKRDIVSDADLLHSCMETTLRVRCPYSLNEAKDIVAKAQETVRRTKTSSREEYYKALLDLYYARVILHNTLKYCKKREITVHVHGLALTREVAIVFLPSEVLVEIGLRIKENSPFPNTIVASYANDYFGYIAPSSEYPKGGYEIEYPVNILEKGEGDKLIELSLKVLRTLFETFD